MIIEKTKYVWTAKSVLTRLEIDLKDFKQILKVSEERCYSGRRGLVFRLYDYDSNLLAIDRFYVSDEFHICQVVEQVCAVEYGLELTIHKIGDGFRVFYNKWNGQNSR